MFVRMLFTKIDPDGLEAVRALYYRDEIGGVLARQKGHRFHYLLESVDDPTEGVFVTAWDNREDAEAFEDTDAYEELADKFTHFHSERPQLRSYEARQ